MAEAALSSTSGGPPKIYYCHLCNAQTSPAPSMLQCTHCGSDFLEEVSGVMVQESGGRSDSDHEDPDRDRDESAPPAAGSRSLRQGGFFRIRDSNLGHPYQIIFADMRPRNRAQPNQAHPLSMLLGQLLGGLGGPAEIFGGAGALMHGSPGDYVWGSQGLDAIITQLLNSMDGSGPPPADKDRIERLPTIKISADQVASNLQCFVCFDDFTLNEEVKVLPCKHHYHKDCILPWLEMHGTCPVCRKDLNGSDTTTQEFDTSIGETLSSLDSTSGTVTSAGSSRDASSSSAAGTSGSASDTVRPVQVSGGEESDSSSQTVMPPSRSTRRYFSEDVE